MEAAQIPPYGLGNLAKGFTRMVAAAGPPATLANERSFKVARGPPGYLPMMEKDRL